MIFSVWIEKLSATDHLTCSHGYGQFFVWLLYTSSRGFTQPDSFRGNIASRKPRCLQNHLISWCNKYNSIKAALTQTKIIQGVYKLSLNGEVCVPVKELKYLIKHLPYLTVSYRTLTKTDTSLRKTEQLCRVCVLLILHAVHIKMCTKCLKLQLHPDWPRLWTHRDVSC